MRFKKYNKIRIVSLISATILLSGCHHMALMNSKGAIGIEQRTLIITAVTLMLIVVIPVILMTLIFAWKYRASNKNAQYRPNWAHSNKIEIVIWTIPVIIIIILGSLTWKSTHELDPFKPISTNKKPIAIEVVSLDWKWLFIYPEQGIASVNELVFPKNVPIEFKVTSNSVMNSFFIPQLGGQIYAMAGMQTKLHLIGNEAGRYTGMSSSYSGPGFSGMKFTTIVTPTKGGFSQWVSKVQESPNNLNTISDFNALSVPSQNSPVLYFSSVKQNLFKEIIEKFMGHTNMHHADNVHTSINIIKGSEVNSDTLARAKE